MLSRSNSSAGDRLRRAKSTSSQITTSSGQHRTSTSTDPFITHQHAETAAIEAYQRAQQQGRLSHQNQRPVPPKLQRRRSQATGRAEGSHFEDARLGRRRSTSNKGDGVQPAAQIPVKCVQDIEARSSYATSDGSAGEERVITRRRSVIPPEASRRQFQSEFLTVPSSSQRIRKPQSAYADGSPTPRNASNIQGQRSSLHLSSPLHQFASGYGTNSTFGEPAEDTLQSLQSPKPSIRETQTDDNILAMARDKCLQDFQRERVRERKSFILAPFQKRRTVTSVPHIGRSNYDTELPPFNYAGDTTFAPLPQPSEPVRSITVHPEKNVDKRNSNFSSLKGRIKSAFRKVSRAQTGLPAQHVEAKHFHYSESEEAYHSLSERTGDPFRTFSSAMAVSRPQSRTVSALSGRSAGNVSDDKSRVTSWTNSTTAGTCTSRADQGHLPSVQEDGTLKRSGSQSTLRKASSFFGRPIKNKLRRPSKAELKGSSDDSEGLYSALQERIRPKVAAIGVPVERGAEDESLRLPSALASLPSQQARASMSSVTRYSMPTVRTVTPDVSAYKIRECSPVLEVLSPDVPNASIRSTLNGEEGTPRTSLQRRPATRAQPPSQDQLARRMQKSQNRWQTPLDELSPAAPRSNRAMLEDNPYELRSLSQSHWQPPPSDDLPHHAKVGPDNCFNRTDMLSPSVYSCGTDGASPRLNTPMEQGSMMVTITGREVRSYSISPTKKIEPSFHRPMQTSGQWRAWLSDELQDFKDSQADFSLTQAFLNGDGSEREDVDDAQARHKAAVARPQDSRPTSISPPVDTLSKSAAAATRPRSSSRRSSYMNERYPMIDTSRSSSDRSIPTRSRVSSMVGDRWASGSQPSSQESARATSGSSADHTGTFDKRRIITGRQSIAHLESARESRTTSCAIQPENQAEGSGVAQAPSAQPPHSDKAAMPSQLKDTKASRHKSAFELRAKYKNSSDGRSTPIEIRRKPISFSPTNILEDTTIRNISAGPYATQQSTTSSAPIQSAPSKNENTPPFEVSNLPALSSSEWLAAGTHKARKPTAVHPALRDRSVSRYSPPKTTHSAGKPGDGKGSPAQRMASEWLEKRSRESTPAFV